MSLLGLRKVMGLAVGLMLLCGAVSAWAQTGGLTGVARGQNGELLAGHPIIIERQAVRGIYRTKTNKKGQYTYIGLPIGDYKVTIQDPAGKDLFFINTRVGMGDSTVLDFDLAKEVAQAEEARKREIEENPELKRKLEEQAKEAKQLTSLKELFEEGQTLMQQQKYPEAVQMFEKALPLAKTTNIPIVLASLAEGYHKSRMYDKAVDAYQKAIEAKPDDATYYNNLGNVYATMGKTTEAAEEFQKAAEMDPTHAARYYFNYGAVMYNMGNMDDSATALRKAIELDPNFADAHFWLGQALVGKATLTPDGKVIAVDGTVEALETYLKLEPNGKNAAAAQQLLQTVQGGIETQYTKPKKKKS